MDFGRLVEKIFFQSINVCPTINSNNYKNLKVKMREICVSRRSDSSYLRPLLHVDQLSRLHYGNLDDHIVIYLAKTDQVE